MKLPQQVLMVMLIGLTACSSAVSAKKPTHPSAARQLAGRAYEERGAPLSQRDCIRFEEFLVCRDELTQPTGRNCACVDRKQIWGQSYSLLGGP